ncbi:hypothetical protein [Flammeovirga sp. SJP92]|uniref:hypothetical protein n=1 Tax=Flammeovirga sp. SJP92 TaxID=1775430 RepID=UPI0007879B35|nr:hypothetical protein [Flammeovirga sp. SJP92]KXX71807.1 hypothetical protein AVL50_03205 [Flammeovirga sp. SJP92]
MKDGKGDYSFIFDFSKSKELFDIISAYTTPEGETIFQANKFKKPLSLISDDLNTIPGIYNCKEILDSTFWKIGIQFTFVDVNALNVALSKIDGKEDVEYLVMKRKKAEWTQNIDWRTIITKNLPTSTEAKNAMLDAIDTAHYAYKWQLNREIKTLKSYDIDQIGSTGVLFKGTIPDDEHYKYITQWNIKFKKEK